MSSIWHRAMAASGAGGSAGARSSASLAPTRAGGFEAGTPFSISGRKPPATNSKNFYKSARYLDYTIGPRPAILKLETCITCNSDLQMHPPHNLAESWTFRAPKTNAASAGAS
jgi:hypothetical protein